MTRRRTERREEERKPPSSLPPGYTTYKTGTKLEEKEEEEEEEEHVRNAPRQTNQDQKAEKPWGDKKQLKHFFLCEISSLFPLEVLKPKTIHIF